MIILTSTSPAAAIPFTPDWLQGRPDAPIFMLRAGDVLEREAMERDLAADYLAPQVSPFEMNDAVIEGFRKLAGSQADELIALQQADFMAGLTKQVTLSIEDQAVLIEARGQLALRWPTYRLLLATMERRKGAIPLVAFRRFCVGWENISSDFAVGIDRQVTAAALTGIDPTVLKIAGWTAYSLQYGGGQEKNSDALSKSGAAQETSSLGAPSKADGSSMKKPTKKTRRSPSRAGRSSSSTSGPGRGRKPR